MTQNLPNDLASLLEFLAAGPLPAPQAWQDWSVTPVAGGANNLLYRVTSDAGDFAVKFTLADGRDRAGREFAALSLLQQAGLDIAPRPVWLDRRGYAQPVVVQTWLGGQTLAGPPATDDEWAAFLDHYRAIHAITPRQTNLPLADGFMNVASVAQGKAQVRNQVDLLPPAAQPASLRAVLAWFEHWSPPTWPAPPRTLVRVDGNWRNFIRGGDRLRSVDWEYSGWGDPIFELSNLTLHPAYNAVGRADWDRFMAAYDERGDDATAAVRRRAYETIMLVWWLVRWARYLYEVPRGLDSRLVSWPEGWLAEVERQYNRYLAQADANNMDVQ